MNPLIPLALGLMLSLLFFNKNDVGIRGCLCGVMVKVMDCRIVVSEFKLQSHYYVHFLTITLKKGMNPLVLQLWARWYRCCSPGTMALALNKLRRLIFPSTKKPSWHQIIHEGGYAIKHRNLTKPPYNTYICSWII